MSSTKTISRRAFGSLLAAAVALPASAEAAGHPHPRRRSPSRSMSKLIKPPRLSQGDVVGLIAPGGYTTERAIDKALKNIESLGFRCKQGAYLRAVHGNYAGSVNQRVADLHAMFADPEVKAIWAIRGGSGCISLLEHLDYKLIRNNPKVLLGYSDITALHLAIHRHARLVTFHGPVASSTMTPYSTEHMMAVLTDPQPTYTIPMSVENSIRALEESHYAIRTLTSGVATGPLMGGNLSMVAALSGTPYAGDYRGSILFLEEVNEAPYRIDRWMTQLDLATDFSKTAALLVGVCDKCGPEEGDQSLTLDETLDLHLKPSIVPAVSGYSIGHIRNQFTIPMGIRARLDTAAQTVTLLEPGVS